MAIRLNFSKSPGAAGYCAVMNPLPMNRRRFLAVAGTTVAAATFRVDAVAAQPKSGPAWSIGCFNRPWSKWSYDDALDELKSAGFTTTGLVGRHPQHPESLLTPDATPDYLDRLRERIAARGITPVIAWIYGPKSKDPIAIVAGLKRLTENAKRLGLTTLLSGGPRRNETVESYIAVMSEVAAHAADLGIKLAMKPHGGDGEEITRCLEQVNHPNFSLWYDAGNIVYYTGTDPVDTLKKLAPNVTGFCAKDCAAKGSPVMIQFGEGKVDFRATFQVLKNAGFQGPVMIECTREAETAAETTRLAVANRRFLERVFADLR
jgi:sugar phosphate isomerase/epimerase